MFAETFEAPFNSLSWVRRLGPVSIVACRPL